MSGKGKVGEQPRARSCSRELPPLQGKLVEPFGVGGIGLQSPSTIRLGLQGNGGYGK